MSKKHKGRIPDAVLARRLGVTVEKLRADRKEAKAHRAVNVLGVYPDSGRNGGGKRNGTTKRIAAMKAGHAKRKGTQAKMAAIATPQGLRASIAEAERSRERFEAQQARDDGTIPDAVLRSAEIKVFENFVIVGAAILEWTPTQRRIARDILNAEGKP